MSNYSDGAAVRIENPAWVMRQLADHLAPFQHTREAVVNAIEHGHATEVECTVEPQAAASMKVMRRMYLDNGQGMDRDRMARLANLADSGADLADDGHSNYGMGVRLATVTWNPRGVVFVTRHQGETMMVVLRQVGDQVRLLERDGESVWTVDGPLEWEGCDWSQVIPYDSGTAVVLLGSNDQPDSVYGNPRHQEERLLSGPMVQYLNERLLDIPDDVKVLVRWPRNQDVERTADVAGFQEPDAKGKVRPNLESYRARGYQPALVNKYGTQDSGAVWLADGSRVDWALLNEGDTSHHNRDPRPGVAIAYQGESYVRAVVGSKRRAWFARAGIRYEAVRKRVALVVTPPESVDGSTGVKPDLDRSTLKAIGYGSTSELPWQDWLEEFAAQMPEPIKQALADATPKVVQGSALNEVMRTALSSLLPRGGGGKRKATQGTTPDAWGDATGGEPDEGDRGPGGGNSHASDPREDTPQDGTDDTSTKDGPIRSRRVRRMKPSSRDTWQVVAQNAIDMEEPWHVGTITSQVSDEGVRTAFVNVDHPSFLEVIAALVEDAPHVDGEVLHQVAMDRVACRMGLAWMHAHALPKDVGGVTVDKRSEVQRSLMAPRGLVAAVSASVDAIVADVLGDLRRLESVSAA